MSDVYEKRMPDGRFVKVQPEHIYFSDSYRFNGTSFCADYDMHEFFSVPSHDGAETNPDE